MYYREVFGDVTKFRQPSGKQCKYAGLVAAGLFSLRLIVKTVKKYKRRQKIAEKQAEIKQSLVRLRQQLQNDGMTAAKSKAITKLSITELQAKLQTGELKAIDVLRAYQFKALEVNDRTNSIVEPIKEAEAWARELDKVTGKKGPLHGIPVSVKECYQIQGYDATAGLSYFIGKPSQTDAVAVKALKAAGAIPFVRTNIPQTMMTFDCSNPIYGVTKNPHDASRSPGGSSGGEGAIIGGGGSILGMGSDIGGSIRIPAHMCGIAGIKPTAERISGAGVFKFNCGQNIKTQNQHTTRQDDDKIYTGFPNKIKQFYVNVAYGPMAQSVDGLILAMKALLDDTMFSSDLQIPPLHFNNQIFESKKKLRIGYYTHDGVMDAIPACVRAVNQTKQTLERLGHTLVPFTPPNVYKAIAEHFCQSVLGDKGNVVAAYIREDELDPSYFITYHWFQTVPFILRKILGGLIKLADPFAGDGMLTNGILYTIDWWNLRNKVDAYRKEFTQYWQSEELDVVLCPGLGCTALPIYKSMEVPKVLTYTTLWNLLNYPAGSLPVTKTTQQDTLDLCNKDIYPAKNMIEKMVVKYCKDSVDLPVNVQIVALPFQEELILRLMKEVEDNHH